MSVVPPRPPSRLGLVIWWLCFALVGVLVSWAVLEDRSWRAFYLLAVAPVAGVLLFPAAWAADRWLTPVIGSRIKGS